MRRPSSAAPRSPSGRGPATDRPPLRKALGQHHLRSGATCRPLLEFLRPAGRRVIEIGPGGGVLTHELLGAGASVLALELDPEWAAELATRLASPQLEIRVADALEFDWNSLPAGALVAGNLPYNVGTAILERLLLVRPPFERLGFLLQREVVDRLVAGPGDSAYGALSVRVAARAAARRLGNVRRGSFVPPPNVDSAFVGLVTHPAPPALTGADVESFDRFVQEAFGMRRKTLVNCLARRHPRAEVEAALAAAGLPVTTRAEALGLDELIALQHRLERGQEAAGEPAGDSPSGTISGRGIEPNH